MLLLGVAMTIGVSVKGEISILTSIMIRQTEEMEMKRNEWNEIDGIMQQAVEKGVIPGGVVLVARNGMIAKVRAYGWAARYRDARKTPLTQAVQATTNTVYDVASLTKLFTATAVMRLVEQGRISLDDPVGRYLSDFTSEGKESITVRYLLSHTSGLPANLPLFQNSGLPEKRMRVAMGTKPVATPGTLYIYSDIGYMVLGELVHRVSGKYLDQFMQEKILLPLSMSSTGFRPPDTWKARIAPTEEQIVPSRGLVWGEVHDENAWALGGVAGHAGLFSTVGDLARFGQMFLNEGSLGGVRVLHPSSVREMFRLQTSTIPHVNRGLGWELHQPGYMGEHTDGKRAGHTGFTGTSIVLDREDGWMLILLTNRVHPTREGPAIAIVRKRLANAVEKTIQ
ncbi:serine hydrolase domain-containing protein [Polycladomyces subterraneus]|uniref:Beta-lactamase family protein n=1 Tax=Polycladomyces subterraneus TaxID=1016997 RepID=A0ABT8IQK5_9BACL|nr:serine hydrolase domain-containing protein [Polycladomyces subterraneus]MDN4595058.1 beta-lactamase family protein [Polycladomyces subterraneus]